jgi:hypothetical protein
MQAARESAPGFTDEPDGLRDAMRRFHSVADKEFSWAPTPRRRSRRPRALETHGRRNIDPMADIAAIRAPLLDQGCDLEADVVHWHSWQRQDHRRRAR